MCNFSFMHVRVLVVFLKVFLHCSTCLLVGGVCLFNTFRQGQKLHAFLPRKCVLGFSFLSLSLSRFFGDGGGV